MYTNLWSPKQRQHHHARVIVRAMGCVMQILVVAIVSPVIQAMIVVYALALKVINGWGMLLLPILCIIQWQNVLERGIVTEILEHASVQNLLVEMRVNEWGVHPLGSTHATEMGNVWISKPWPVTKTI